MRSSMRQPRKDQNRNCSTAAESTIVSHLFEGQLSYMTVCMHCDQQAHSTQSFTILSLPIPADIIKCSIQVPPNSWAIPSRLYTGPILGAGGRLVLIIHIFSQFCLYTVQDCLSLFFEQTILTGGEQMLCSVCELRRESTVLTCLDKPPEILMLHLKRWVETNTSYVSLMNEGTEC